MPQVRTDVFPALITIASTDPENPHSRQVSSARIIVTENRVIIAVDSANGPRLVFAQNYDPASLNLVRPRTAPSTLTTETGQLLTFQKDDSCGCGSRLRSWNPFKNITSSADPV